MRYGPVPSPTRLDGRERGVVPQRHVNDGQPTPAAWVVLEFLAAYFIDGAANLGENFVGRSFGVDLSQNPSPAVVIQQRLGQLAVLPKSLADRARGRRRAGRGPAAARSTAVRTHRVQAPGRAASCARPACDRALRPEARCAGKPSNKQPERQSLSERRSPTMPTTTSSGTSLPAFMKRSASAPSSVPASTASRSISPVERWQM